MNAATETKPSGSQSNRWVQLLLGVIAMMAISSPQYVWTLFTGPLNQKLGTTLAELQWTFSLLIILQTWFSPFQAYLGYGFGAFFTSFPIDSMIKSSGYAHTLIVWGIVQGVIGVLAAQWLRVPPEN